MAKKCVVENIGRGGGVIMHCNEKARTDWPKRSVCAYSLIGGSGSFD